MKRSPHFRKTLITFIRVQARPPEKFSHQARLFRLACKLAQDTPCDREVLFAAAWLHDLGVFEGHRPSRPAQLARWDHLAYTLGKAPAVLRRFGFPETRIAAVLEAIRTHTPSGHPTTFEATLLRDADLLEQLGAISVLRTVAKTGRDTRFVRFSDSLALLRHNLKTLPRLLRLPAARRLAAPRVKALQAFLVAARNEADGIAW